MAEANKVSCNEVQDLVVAQIVLELEDVLHQVVTKCVLNQNVDAANNDMSESQFLGN